MDGGLISGPGASLGWSSCFLSGHPATCQAWGRGGELSASQQNYGGLSIFASLARPLLTRPQAEVKDPPLFCCSPWALSLGPLPGPDDGT